jgi:hypothetical protein
MQTHLPNCTDTDQSSAIFHHPDSGAMMLPCPSFSLKMSKSPLHK